jgi:hypothetical protein
MAGSSGKTAAVRMAIACLATVLVTSACSKSVTGDYSCSGIPMMDTLSLKPDGSYVSHSSVLGHATTGTGKYAVSGDHVVLDGTVQTEGISDVDKDSTDFQRQSDGSLKMELGSCKQ